MPLSANNFGTETAAEGVAGPRAEADTRAQAEDDARSTRVEVAYRKGRERSERLWERARGVLPGGVSGAAKYYAPFPLFIAGARGARATDVDGNEYVDLLMGAGPMLLGHGHPRVLEAVRRQLGEMTNPMLPSEHSLELAERIRGHMPYMERLRFANTGSEATRSAVRVARVIRGPAHPARPLIAKCEGAFHGSDDMFLVSGHSRTPAGSDARPEPVADYAGLLPGIEDGVVLLPYNDPVAAGELIAERAHELACVIVEPLAFSSGGGMPATPEFARALREACTRHEVPLIFDEVLCAYRMGLSGAPAWLGVTPDLAAIGKAIGGGMALSAFGGRAELMEAAFRMDGDPAHPENPPHPENPARSSPAIFQSGTFTENPVAVAAGLAVLDVLETEPVLERADRTGELLRAGLREIFATHGITAAVAGAASIAQVHFGIERVESRRDVLRADTQATHAFQLGMVAEGVLWPPGHPALTSGAHTDEDIERALRAAETVLSR